LLVLKILLFFLKKPLDRFSVVGYFGKYADINVMPRLVMGFIGNLFCCDAGNKFHVVKAHKFVLKNGVCRISLPEVYR
jgi:hypothetical protein